MEKFARAGFAAFTHLSICDTRELADEAFDKCQPQAGYTVEMHTMPLNQTKFSIRQMLREKMCAEVVSSPDDSFDDGDDDTEEIESAKKSPTLSSTASSSSPSSSTSSSERKKRSRE